LPFELPVDEERASIRSGVSTQETGSAVLDIIGMIAVAGVSGPGG
jgi:hypothetical protein